MNTSAGAGGLGVAALRRYVLTVAAGNLAWEVLQLPLYHIWYHAGLLRLAFIALAGTSGDIPIAIVSLVCAFSLFGRERAAPPISPAVAWTTIAIGLVYTIGSEMVHLRLGTWHYAALMPRLPLLGVGLGPTLQWVAIPPLALRAAGGRFLPRHRSGTG
ncbi:MULTISPECIES: hypothetical protein [unclassified Acidiphilium]|uniref:hypothetical protein n=1 Tax=unclassified Acidiphilium TaxID=2617493 RepID=UPI000BDAE2AF|nr:MULTISPECIES: hypothetical protein [unclassified Acidiphilium]OYV56598.1 MAG: hypothetical protein B7Z76_05240 [Acidiphilium sp. 20-67-58]OYV85757.1 MAG: hypothetical protein B7Z64_04925 [Acidiphilium sp. 21-68-69]HQT62017.1 hypothetical protein [Acidiphilium sp.]